jgi:hypothetical protein
LRQLALWFLPHVGRQAGRTDPTRDPTRGTYVFPSENSDRHEMIGRL